MLNIPKNIADWKKTLVESLNDNGIINGSCILVHSSFKAISCPGTPDDVVDSLLDAVGSDGMLAVPTHTWDIVNARQPVFDVVLTPSHVGVITECVRRRSESVRSLHPTHSVAAIGKRAKNFVVDHEKDETPCSKRSPYGRIVDWDGYIVMLGVSLLYNTTFHGIEEWNNMPGLFVSGYKENLYAIDKDGNRLYIPSFRHAGKDRKFEETTAPMQKEGILNIIQWGEKEIIVVKAKPMAEYISAQMRKDLYYLLDDKYRSL